MSSTSTSVIEKLLRMQAEICHNEKQSAYCNLVLQNFKEVKISRIQEFPPNICEQIKKVLEITKPITRQCYKNAAYLTTIAHPSLAINYVEGYYTCYGIPMEHAFNSIEINGEKKYFDVTVEFAFTSDQEKPTEYASIYEFDYKSLMDHLLKEQMFTQFYPSVLAKIIEEK